MNPRNLQVRYLYQIHLREAKGASEKTIDEVVSAIAELEEHTGCRDFHRLQKRHSQSFKKRLIERDAARPMVGRSPSLQFCISSFICVLF